jgi:hypothetical protein
MRSGCYKFTPLLPLAQARLLSKPGNSGCATGVSQLIGPASHNPSSSSSSSPPPHIRDRFSGEHCHCSHIMKQCCMGACRSLKDRSTCAKGCLQLHYKVFAVCTGATAPRNHSLGPMNRLKGFRMSAYSAVNGLRGKELCEAQFVAFMLGFG